MASKDLTPSTLGAVYVETSTTEGGLCVAEIQALHYCGLGIEPTPEAAFERARERVTRSIQMDLRRLRSALDDVKKLQAS